MTFRTAWLGAALLAALGACTDNAGPASSEQTARLRIVVRDTDKAPPKTASLDCGEKASGEGMLSDPQKSAAACTLVLGNQGASLLLGPAPADRVCTMVYGGPQVARVSGTLRGQLVNKEFKRTNGCEIADWTALAPLLGEPAQGGGVPQ